LIKVINAKNRSVLIISDTHAPYTHKDYFKFLKAVKKKYLNKKSIIFHVGDEVDNHAISFHKSESELFSAGDELDEAITYIKALESLFPKMYLCESNHGSLLYRRLKFEGIPIRALKSLQEIYSVKKWQWYDDYRIITNNPLDTYLCHGKAARYNALAKDVGMNAIQGHFHSKFEITYSKSPLAERYNMFIGCLIDVDSLAFRYGRNNLPKPILGVGLITESGHPILIKMNLDKKGHWNGKL